MSVTPVATIWKVTVSLGSIWIPVSEASRLKLIVPPSALVLPDTSGLSSITRWFPAPLIRTVDETTIPVLNGGTGIKIEPEAWTRTRYTRVVSPEVKGSAVMKVPSIVPGAVHVIDSTPRIGITTIRMGGLTGGVGAKGRFLSPSGLCNRFRQGTNKEHEPDFDLRRGLHRRLRSVANTVAGYIV